MGNVRKECGRRWILCPKQDSCFCRLPPLLGKKEFHVSSHGESEKSSVTDNRPTVYSLVWQYFSSLPNMLGSPSSSDRMYLFRKRVQKLKKYQRPR